MAVHTDFRNLPEAAKGLSIALGNFDGLHAGHRAVLDAARTAADATACGLGAAVFEPPPRRYFQPDAPPFRIMRPELRSMALHGLGCDHVFELPFNAEMANMDDRTFVKEVLVDGLAVSNVSVGFDFQFGKDRVGTTQSLIQLGDEFGFGVTVVAEVGEAAGKVSSTAIREALTSGRPREAAELLGGWWIADGIVEHGEKRGRTIGFPTANLHLGNLIHPKFGIYAVWAMVEGHEGWRPGVANFGRTPTTGLRDPLLEVYLFEFDGDIYDRRIDVAFVEFIRPEATFPSLDSLVTQMQSDALEARRILEVGETVVPIMDACPPL